MRRKVKLRRKSQALKRGRTKRSPWAVEAAAAAPKKDQQLDKKKPKSKPKLDLFSPAKTPTGAIVLFDPVKVEHPQSAKRAKLVTLLRWNKVLPHYDALVECNMMVIEEQGRVAA